MYNIYNLSQDAQKDYTALQSTGQSKSLLMSVLLAKSLADRETIPSGKVDDLQDYFRTTCLISVTSKLSKFNEILSVDVDSVLDITYRFYQLRYSNTFPILAISCYNKDTVVEDFFNISKFISRTAIDTIQQDPPKATIYYKAINSILNDLINPDNSQSDINI